MPGRISRIESLPHAPWRLVLQSPDCQGVLFILLRHYRRIHHREPAEPVRLAAIQNAEELMLQTVR